MGFGAREKWVQVLALPWISFLKCIRLNNLMYQMGIVLTSPLQLYTLLTLSIQIAG